MKVKFHLLIVTALYGEDRFSDIHISQTLTPLSLHPLAFQLANVQPLLGILMSNVLSGSQRF